MTKGIEDPAHAAEAHARWGHTDAYKESVRRTQDHTREDWAVIQAEGDAIEARYAELLASGEAPDSAASMDAAENHRVHIERWFYACSRAMHSELGRMYIEDDRFKSHYEERATGLAGFISSAIAANANRQD